MSDTPASTHAPDADAMTALPNLSTRAITRCTILLLIVGLAARLLRYALDFPIWGDEAMLAVNFAWLDYRQLTQGLHLTQVAPLLFVWGERTAYLWLGPDEYSLRLLPLLAGVGSLLLYWHLTRVLLPPLARLFAVGFMAAAIWPVGMCNLIKPYSFDLLMALALLVPAAHWLNQPQQRRWLILLTVITPIALLGSYTAVLVAGAVSLALARPVWRECRGTRAWFAAYNVAMIAGFLATSAVANGQLSTTTHGTSTEAGMAQYWNDNFPPANPLSAVVWGILQTLGQMTAYPAGSANGGSAITVFLCIVGIIHWCRRGKGALVMLLTAPIALNLVAAILHRYPYGVGRLSQHLAPGICLLAGLGLAVMIVHVIRPVRSKLHVTIGAVIVFLALGVGLMVRDVVKPYRKPSYVWIRSTMEAIHRQVPADEPVIICGTTNSFEAVFVWHWSIEGSRVTWDEALPPLEPTTRRVWAFHHGNKADECFRRVAAALNERSEGWRIASRTPYVFEGQGHRDPPQRCEVISFERAP